MDHRAGSPGLDDVIASKGLGFAELARALYVEQYGEWFGPWMDERDRANGPGITGCIEPRRMYAKG